MCCSGWPGLVLRSPNLLLTCRRCGRPIELAMDAIRSLPAESAAISDNSARLRRVELTRTSKPRPAIST